MLLRWCKDAENKSKMAVGCYLEQESCNIAKMFARCALAFLTDLHNPTIRTWFAARKSICTI